MNGERLNISLRVPQLKAKKLRRQGYVPGILYGNNISTPVIFDKKNVENYVQRMGEGAIFEVALDGKACLVRIREVQRDPVYQDIIHIDLQTVDMNKKIQAQVPLKLEGKQSVEKRGYILQRQKNTIEVEGLAKDIPSHIKVPLYMLQRSSNIRVRDLEIAAELSILDAPDEIIALTLKPSKEKDSGPKTSAIAVSADSTEQA